MKSRSLALVLAGLCILLALVSPASAVPPTREELTKAYNTAIASFTKEDYATAERQFNFVLQHVPGHALSRKYLVEIEAKRKAVASIPAMEKELARIIVPELKVEEVSLEDFLGLVVLKTKELSGGKTVPNFVFRPSTPEMTERLVSLTLSGVPVSELLRHAGQITDTKFTYDKYAILVSPARSSAVDAETQAALDAAAKTAGQ